VVAGSAINEGVWLPEAMQFMEVHRAELATKPFAAFLVLQRDFVLLRDFDSYYEILRFTLIGEP